MYTTHTMVLTDICIEIHELVPEHLPGFALRPDQQHAGAHCRDEMMCSPPTFDARPVHLQNRLADRERAIVPYQQEQERQLKRTVSDIKSVEMYTFHIGFDLELTGC